VSASRLDNELDLNIWIIEIISTKNHAASNAMPSFPNQPGRPEQIAAILNR